MILKNSIYVCMMSILLLMATQVRSQTTHIVDNNPNTAAGFTDLQNAINAAADNDTIYVQQSNTNYDDITLDKSLTIIGRSHSDTNYKTEISGNIEITSGASNSTIKGLDFGSLVEDNLASGTINNLKILDCDVTISDIGDVGGVGLDLIYNNLVIKGNIINSMQSVNATNLLVTNNVIKGSVGLSQPQTVLFSNNIMDATVSLFNNGSGSAAPLNVNNCIFIHDSSNAETLFLSGNNYQFENCITYNFGSGTLTFGSSGNVTLINNQENVDPLFTIIDSNGILGNFYNPNSDDLTLQPNSPVVDDGLYEGYDFKPFGTPTGFPYVKIDAYSSTVPVNGDLNVTITTKAN